jgi:hypothetical protein
MNLKRKTLKEEKREIADALGIPLGEVSEDVVADWRKVQAETEKQGYPEVEFQLNVTGRYESEAVTLRKIQEAVQKAVDNVASCDMVEVSYAHPDLGDYEDVNE